MQIENRSANAILYHVQPWLTHLICSCCAQQSRTGGVTRVDKFGNEFSEFQEAAGPAMDEDQGDGIGALGPLMHKVQVDGVHMHREVI